MLSWGHMGSPEGARAFMGALSLLMLMPQPFPCHLLLQEFQGGITNGAQWYPLYGGMQDWNYLAAGCMEVRVGVQEMLFCIHCMGARRTGTTELLAVWRCRL